MTRQIHDMSKNIAYFLFKSITQVKKPKCQINVHDHGN